MLKNGHSEHSLESLRAPGTIFRIGRIDGSDLRLEHHAFPLLVSRNHAELFVEDGFLMLKNLNPLNGTYLSGRKLEAGEATPVTEGEIISFGGPKAIHTADSQHLQCSNPHTYAVVGLQGLLPASPALDSFGSTQQLDEPPADTFEAPVLPKEAAVPTSEHAGEAQEAPASRPETHPADEWVPARHLLEDTSPQEHVQQPDAVVAAPQPPEMEASAPVMEARAYSPEPTARHLLDTSSEAEGQEPDAVAHQPPASEASAAFQHNLRAPLQPAGIRLSAGDGHILTSQSRAAAAAESTIADGNEAPSNQSRELAAAVARNILNVSPEGQGQQPDASAAAEPAADASAAARPALPASAQPAGVWVSARDGRILSAEGAAAQQPAADAKATAQPVLAASKQQHAAQAVGSNLASSAARQEQPSPYRAVTSRAAELQKSIIDLTEGNDDDDDIDVVGDSPPVPPPLPAEIAAQTPQDAQNRPRLTGAKRASQAIELDDDDDDDDVEILYNSQPAAASAAPRKAASSSAASAARITGAASNQGDWLKDVEDEFSCAVCQESIIAAHCLVPCGHCFCGNCLFQWLSRKQICPTCRQPLEAPPVRSTGMDNILDKTEKHMTPAEVEDRAQRKLNWQAFAEEAATSWKAMFQAKRQRGADRDPPRHPIDIYLVSSGVMSIFIMQGRSNEALLPHAYAFLEDLQAASQQRMQRRRRGVQRSPQAAARGRSEAEPQYYPPVPPPYARHRPRVPSLQPSDLVGGAPMHAVRQHQQPPQGSAGLRVEYPQASGQPNHCLACRRGFQAGVPRLSSGNRDPIAWHLDCYQLWPMLATSRTSITGISRMTPTHQADILRRLGNHR